ncbi:substrate-binding periplasmic protein [Spartinivicinus ruber]|uniref:substrate-binding periplasmic protein n=1 Tax=Spartinivicinus ruber TaxID=2683272 RepID=UPI0013CFBEBA|nr:ABC transporter substrate-binding protein [Spartinivicinus ruber]
MKAKLYLIALVLITSATYSKLWACKTLRLATGEWPPYVSQDLKHYGFISLVVAEAFKLASNDLITVEFQFFPWQRGLMLAKQGKFHGASFWGKSAEREQSFYYSNSLFTAPYVFWHLKSFKFNWQQVDDLKPYKIGGLIGANYGDAFQQAESAGQLIVERTPTEPPNFMKLLQGRIQLYPLDREVGYSILSKLYQPEQARKIVYHPTPLINPSYYLLINKKTKKAKKIITAFNIGLAQLKQSGRYEELFKLSRQGYFNLSSNKLSK